MSPWQSPQERPIDPCTEASQALASEGRGLLISTHNLAFAESVCSRIGMLSQGELRFVGTIEEARVHFGRPGAGLEELFMVAVHGDSLNRGPSE